MTDQQKLFFELAIVKQMKYADISVQLNIDRPTLTKWWDDFKVYRIELAEIRKIWSVKFDSNQINFETFKTWYTSTEKKCEYCRISQEEIEELRANNKIQTKRKRGYKLEIDRKAPNEEYNNISNLVYCCYWCNNAKTDEFSETEFKQIGKAIGEVWKQRTNGC